MKVFRIKITVWGYVQGVFFRYSTRKFARKLGLTGFVKNLPDGTVFIEAEGPKPKLNELLKFAKKGPRHAQVEKVEYEFTEPKYDYKRFEYEF